MTPRKKTKIWSVYVLRCADNSLYTGITNDMERRLKMHNDGIAARYTRGRLPVCLGYQEHRMTRSQALKREHAIKAMTRRAKEKLLSAAAAE